MPLNQIKSNLVDMVLTRHTSLSMTTICKKTYVEHCGKIYLHKILVNTYVEHRGKIYLHKILGNMIC
jgi:hypothetical protein